MLCRIFFIWRPSECSTCPYGTYSEAGSSECRIYKPGSEPLNNRTGCISFSSKYYSKEGSLESSQCPINSFSLQNSTTYIKCPKKLLSK